MPLLKVHIHRCTGPDHVRRREDKNVRKEPITRMPHDLSTHMLRRPHHHPVRICGPRKGSLKPHAMATRKRSHTDPAPEVRVSLREDKGWPRRTPGAGEAVCAVDERLVATLINELQDVSPGKATSVADFESGRVQNTLFHLIAPSVERQRDGRRGEGEKGIRG